MYTIVDYVKYYRDISIQKVGWNVMDNLICAILCYLPLNSFKDKMMLNNLYFKCKRLKSDDMMLTNMAMNILELMVDSDRYRNLSVSNVVIKKNRETQFGAITFKINKVTVISFKGTDASNIGWLENFRLIYEYPTNTQKLAIDYLNNNISLLNNNDVYVVGHSKGGNLAMVSALEASRFNFNKIKRVYNFDGPGFRKKEYDSLKFKKLSTKLVNIIPSGSVIGVLMHNNAYQVIKSNTISVLDHFPTTWNIFGEFFVEDKLSSLGKKLNNRTTIQLEKLDSEMFRETIETLFKALGQEHTADVKITFRDIKRVLGKMKDVDPKIKSFLDEIFHTLIISSTKKRNNKVSSK